MITNLITEISEEVISIFQGFKKQIQESVNDLKNEIKNLRTDFVVEIEKFKTKFKI
ncbi:hypothetical protein ISS85_00250 [Candidatus Microgenomates bacterium]|nr:hypothetical protein [Candidatus Microgenomates bacterium]